MPCQNRDYVLQTLIMSGPNDQPKTNNAEATPPSFGKSVILIIIFSFAIVALFAVILFLLIRGGQQVGLSTTGYIAIFVVISGIFAWLVKRLSDTVSGMSRYWFSEEDEKID